ncbi:MAG: hypothetical protein LBH39_07150 [Clostridiales Family XIII bacterium]|jgi:hypothetical protein|nr:hypothetical protein [Clostridiales Family XIII bacterium]
MAEQTAKKKKAFAAMGIGVTSLLTIMAVLLLTSFAVMALMSAKSDMELSDKASQAVSSYYEADCLAEEWWAGLNEMLKGQAGGASERMLADAGYDVEDVDGALIVRTAFPMGEKKNLEVAVEVSREGSATVLSWKSVPVYTPQE